LKHHGSRHLHARADCKSPSGASPTTLNYTRTRHGRRTIAQRQPGRPGPRCCPDRCSGFRRKSPPSQSVSFPIGWVVGVVVDIETSTSGDLTARSCTLESALSLVKRLRTNAFMFQNQPMSREGVLQQMHAVVGRVDGHGRGAIRFARLGLLIALQHRRLLTQWIANTAIERSCHHCEGAGGPYRCVSQKSIPSSRYFSHSIWSTRSRTASITVSPNPHIPV